MKAPAFILSVLSVLLLFSCRKAKNSTPAPASAFPYTDTFSGEGHVTHNYLNYTPFVTFSLDTSYVSSVFVTHPDSNTVSFNFSFRDYEADGSQAGYSAYTYSQSNTFPVMATGMYLDSVHHHKTRYQLIGDSLTISKSDESPFTDPSDARSFYFSGKR